MTQLQGFEAFIHQIMLLLILIILYLISQDYWHQGGTGHPVEHTDTTSIQGDHPPPVNTQAIGLQPIISLLCFLTVTCIIIEEAIKQYYRFQGETGTPVEHGDSFSIEITGNVYPIQEEHPPNAQAVGLQRVGIMTRHLDSGQERLEYGGDFVCQQLHENTWRRRQNNEAIVNQQRLSESEEESLESSSQSNCQEKCPEQNADTMVNSEGLEASKNSKADDWGGARPKEPIKSKRNRQQSEPTPSGSADSNLPTDAEIITQDHGQERLEYSGGFACQQHNENVLRRRKNINETLRNPQRLPRNPQRLPENKKSTIHELSNNTKTVKLNGARPKKLTKPRRKKKKPNQPAPSCFADTTLPKDVDTGQSRSQMQENECVANPEGVDNSKSIAVVGGAGAMPKKAKKKKKDVTPTPLTQSAFTHQADLSLPTDMDTGTSSLQAQDNGNPQRPARSDPNAADEQREGNDKPDFVVEREIDDVPFNKPSEPNS